MRALALVLAFWPGFVLAQRFEDAARSYAAELEARILQGRLLTQEIEYPEPLWDIMEEATGMSRDELRTRIVQGYERAAGQFTPLSSTWDLDRAIWGVDSAGPFVLLPVRNTLYSTENQAPFETCTAMIIADFDGVLFFWPLSQEQNFAPLLQAYPRLRSSFETLGIGRRAERLDLCSDAAGLS